jgi:hypothetical protein
VSSQTAAFLAYDGHFTDDSPGGDDDGDVEAGETVRVTVTWRNRGSTSASSPSFDLWPTPTTILDLDINGEFRPDRTYIGKRGGHPPETSETFRLPLSWEGLRVEGEPTGVSVNDESFKVWREEDTGLYVVSAQSPSASADSIFTGILKTSGSFSDVSLVGESGVDEYFWDGDSAWFSFRGDATEDKLIFRAEAPDWLEVSEVQTPVRRTIVAGDTVTYSFDLELTEKIPDEQTLVLTAVSNHNTTTWAHTDFAIQVKAPETELLVLEWACGDYSAGCDTSLAVYPSIRNGGTAEADSVHVIFHKVSGDATVLDSLVSFLEIEPDSVAVPSDSILICADTYQDLMGVEFDVEIRTFVGGQYQQLYYAQDLGDDHGNFDPNIPVPENLILDSSGQSMILRWDPVAGASYYMVYHQPETGPKEYLGIAKGSSRFDATHVRGERLDPMEGEAGDGTMNPYSFQVRTCRCYQCGPSAAVGPDHAWLEEAEGWPKRVPGGLSTAPKVGYLNRGEGLEPAVFVAGKAVYAWWLEDGAPLRSGSGYANGLFFDPELPNDSKKLFTEALALFEYEDEEETTNLAFVGNVRDDSLYCVLIVEDTGNSGYFHPERMWSRGTTSKASPPVVAYLLENEPNPQILIPGDDEYLYAWTADGDPYLWNAAPAGAFARSVGSGYNYNSVAIAKYPNNTSGRDHVVQALRDGKLVLWNPPQNRSQQGLASSVWSFQLESSGAAYLLSTPAVGDLDSDYRDEVVVTNHGAPGKIYKVDVYTESVDTETDATWDFGYDGDLPAPRPTVSFSNVLNMEAAIAVAGRVSGTDVAEHKVHILIDDEDEESCFDRQVLPSRSGEPEATRIWHEVILFDGARGDNTIEALGVSLYGSVYVWEFDLDESECSPKKGWPILLSDMARTPYVDDSTLLISAEDEFLHHFLLPESADHLGFWMQFGRDRQNSGRAKKWIEAGGGMAAPEAGAVSVAPLPFNPVQAIRFTVANPQNVELAVYDVRGRRVRALLNRELGVGDHTVVWDGRDDRKAPVGSGIYFYRLKRDGELTVHRTVLVK